MARIRSIKPTFFLDSDMSSLSPMARIFFIGLWCLADREGRLKDKPRELGVQLIPYDLPKADPEALLNELAPRFLLRYQVEGKGYIYIRGFHKHQRPANSEPASDLPEPPSDILATDLFVASSTCDEQKGQERKGRERKGKEGKGMEYTPAFTEFWQAYPHKTGKGAAWRAWEKVSPDLGACLKALEWQRVQPQWTKDGGKFIPHPSTWLNQKRWEDEPMRVNDGNASRSVQGKYDSDVVIEDGVVVKGGKV